MKETLKTIICTTDFSEISKLTIYYGAALAKLSGAKLYVCHVVDLPHVDMYGETVFLDSTNKQNKLMADAQHEMDQWILSVDIDKGVEYEQIIRVGSVDEELARLAKNKDADLVIATSHGRSGIKKLAMGSVTERLMRTLSLPLMVIQSSAQGKDISPDKILVGCDFSEDSKIAADFGRRLARALQSELHLVHVLTKSMYESAWNESTAKDKDVFDKEIRGKYEAKLAELIPQEDAGKFSLKTTLLTGKAYKELLAYAADNAVSLILLGTRGIGLVESIFVGSTTDRVMHQAPCPVVSVCSK